MNKEKQKTLEIFFFRIFSWIQGTKSVNQLKFHDSMKNTPQQKNIKQKIQTF